MQITFNRAGLSPAMSARLDAALEKRFRLPSGAIVTQAEYIQGYGAICRRVMDGTAGWDRRRFNRMTGPEQRAYEARLAAKREYLIGNADDLYASVPKLVYDALDCLPIHEKSLA